MTNKRHLVLVEGRTCGGCTECCRLLHVEAFGKREFEECAHAIKGEGCNGYETFQPENCRKYQCSWLAGVGPEDHRPDRIGFLINVTDEMCAFYEGRPGALSTEAGIRAVRNLAVHRRVGIVYETGERMYLTAKKVEENEGVPTAMPTEPMKNLDGHP